MRAPAKVGMGQPKTLRGAKQGQGFSSLSQFREKERSQLPDSHENKINRHVNEMCFGCGFVYVGKKSSETYDSASLFFFLSSVPLSARGVIFKSMGSWF